MMSLSTDRSLSQISERSADSSRSRSSLKYTEELDRSSPQPSSPPTRASIPNQEPQKRKVKNHFKKRLDYVK